MDLAVSPGDDAQPCPAPLSPCTVTAGVTKHLQGSRKRQAAADKGLGAVTDTGHGPGEPGSVTGTRHKGQDTDSTPGWPRWETQLPSPVHSPVLLGVTGSYCSADPALTQLNPFSVIHFKSFISS